MGNKLTNEYFLRVVKRNHPNKTVLSKYTNCVTKVRVQCVCGHIYFTSPMNLLYSSSKYCKSCVAPLNGKSSTVLHEEFVKRVKEINPGFQILSAYRHSHKKIKYKCTCGQVSFGFPCALTRKRTGCMKCHGSKVSKYRTTKDSDFKKAIKNYNNITGRKLTYAGNGQVTCENGHTWRTWISSLNRGNGCGQCSRGLMRSKTSSYWLSDLEKKLRLRIIGARVEDEEYLAIPPKIKVDGYNRRYNLVFEFYGDYFHGNKRAWYNEADEYLRSDRYNRTMDREGKLRNAGYTVIRIWEHQFFDPVKYQKWLLRTMSKIGSIRSHNK